MRNKLIFISGLFIAAGAFACAYGYYYNSGTDDTVINLAQAANESDNRLIIRAKSDLAGTRDGPADYKQGAFMIVRVNGQVIDSEQVMATNNYQDYSFNLPTVAAGTKIDVVYTNDSNTAEGQDRNLFVKSITANGQTIAADAPEVTFDRATEDFDTSFDGQDTMPGTSGLYWNGALRFVLGGNTENSNIKVEIDTTPTGIIRSDIGRQTFGGGIVFQTAQLRWTMDGINITEGGLGAPTSSKTADAIKKLNLGTFRFPDGDASFLYVSEDPQASFNGGKPSPNENDLINRYLSPGEIIKYTAPDKLNMERIFTVNTAFWLNKGSDGPWGLRYIDDRKNYDGTNGTVQIKGKCPIISTVLCSDYLDITATKAADWVARDNAQTQLWEIGNEDWSRLNGEQYAEVFYTFQDKMKTVRPDIKLLATGLAENYDDNGNTPENWFNPLKQKLLDTNKIDSVYAYSVHQYIHVDPELYVGDAAMRRSNQTQDMLAEVAEGKKVNDVKALLGVNSPTSITRNWKIWMTEFNVWQPELKKNPNDKKMPEVLQDMGHALVIADWTGKMLEQNVERMSMLSLDHGPAFALVQYINRPDSDDILFNIENPLVNVPGYAYSMYAQNFGKTMVKNSINNNPQLTAPNGKAYPQLGVYSSISEDNKSLRVMIINRNLKDAVNFDLNTKDIANGRKLDNGTYSHQQLSSSNITDNNLKGEKVKWSEPVYKDQKEAGLQNIALAPASANLFVLPLQ